VILELLEHKVFDVLRVPESIGNLVATICRPALYWNHALGKENTFLKTIYIFQSST